MNKNNIVYTPEAEKRLEKAKEDFVEKLEGVVKSRKYYPGDEVLEITASDIEIATNYLVFRRPNSTATKLNIVVSYMLIGVLMTFFGLFYEEIIRLFIENPIRLILVFGGLTTSIAGLWMYMKIKQENQVNLSKELYIKEKEIEKKNLLTKG